jgi:hypothetical protein
MSTSERLIQRTESWNWWSHHRRLAIDGNVAFHWKNIPPLWDTHMSNLGFELWWAGDTTLLTTQPQVDSHACTNIYMHMWYNMTMWLLDHPIRASQMWNITNNIKFRSRTRRGIPSTVRCVEGFTRQSYCAPLSPCLPPTLNRSSACALPLHPGALQRSHSTAPTSSFLTPHAMFCRNKGATANGFHPCNLTVEEVWAL